MITKCDVCEAEFDDQYRLMHCPHNTFRANDGRNNFAYHEKAYLSTDPTTEKSYSAPLHIDP